MRRRAAEAKGQAHALAEAVVAVLEDESLVARFVDSYAARYNRASLRAHHLQYREMMTTIGREALLAMVARLEDELPRRLGPHNRPLLRTPTAHALETFRAEFLAALADALDWVPAELEVFRRDGQLYAQLAAREGSSTRPHRPGEAVQGAFVDRCALLLDPSMLDKARTAAAQFLLELHSLADQVLRKVFRARRGS